MRKRIVAVSCLVGALSVGCGSESKDNSDNDAAGGMTQGGSGAVGGSVNGEGGSASVSGNGGTNSEIADVLATADVDLQALTAATESIADCGADLSLALLEGTHAVRGQLASFDLGCDPDGRAMTVSINGEVVESTPVGAVFAATLPDAAEVSLSVSVGGATAELALPLEDIPQIADAREYVGQTIDTLLASLDGELAMQGQSALQAARDMLATASDAEVEKLAVLLASYGIGENLVEQAFCSRSTQEAKLTCLMPKVPANVILAAALVYTTAGLCNAALIPGATAVAGLGCLISAGALIVQARVCRELSAEAWSTSGQLTVPEFFLDQVASGAVTHWSGEGSYVSVGGFQLGAGKELAGEFRAGVERLSVLLLKIYEFARRQFTGPTSSDPAVETSAAIDPAYVTVTLAELVEDVSLQVAATATGWDVTLTNSSEQPKTARLRFVYRFQGVQELEKIVDVVVQPAPSNCMTTEAAGSASRVCMDEATQKVVSREQCTIADGVCQTWERRLYHTDGTTSSALIQAGGYTGAESTTYLEERWDEYGTSLASGYSRSDTSGYQYNFGQIRTATSCRYYESTVQPGQATTGCDTGVLDGACPPAGCGPMPGGPTFSFSAADAITPLVVSDVTIIADGLCGVGCAYAE